MYANFADVLVLDLVKKATSLLQHFPPQTHYCLVFAWEDTEYIPTIGSVINRPSLKRQKRVKQAVSVQLQKLTATVPLLSPKLLKCSQKKIWGRLIHCITNNELAMIRAVSFLNLIKTTLSSVYNYLTFNFKINGP